MSIAEEMANLFDVNLDEIKSASDYGDLSEDSSPAGFEDKCDDLGDIVKSVLPKNTCDNMNNAIQEDLSQTTLDQDQKAEVVTEKTQHVTEATTETDDQTLQDIPDHNVTQDDNPLGLEGRYAIAYKKIKEQYPSFSLYDGSQAFKDFYIWKTKMLTNLLVRFPILDIKELSAEVRQVKLNHEIGSDYITPETIRRKLDRIYSNKSRLATLLMDCYEQFPSWKKISEMLNSKLFKEHAQRGAHNRDALVLEHMNDVSFYVTELEGFIDSAKSIDHILQAAAESLSRQLTCIQLKESTGTHLDAGNGMDTERLSESEKDDHLDELDSIDEGTLISKPKAMGPIEENFGIAGSDDVSDLIG